MNRKRVVALVKAFELTSASLPRTLAPRFGTPIAQPLRNDPSAMAALKKVEQQQAALTSNAAAGAAPACGSDSRVMGPNTIEVDNPYNSAV